MRDQLTDSQRNDVERHLIDCPSCQQAVSELRDVNASLRKLLPPAVSVLAAPLTVGITTLGTMSGLFSSGLLLKGATAVLVATPLLFNVTGGSRGGDTMDDDEVRTVVAAPLDVDADDDPIVAAPPQSACRAFTADRVAGHDHHDCPSSRRRAGATWSDPGGRTIVGADAADRRRHVTCDRRGSRSGDR